MYWICNAFKPGLLNEPHLNTIDQQLATQIMPSNLMSLIVCLPDVSIHAYHQFGWLRLYGYKSWSFNFLVLNTLVFDWTMFTKILAFQQFAKILRLVDYGERGRNFFTQNILKATVAPLSRLTIALVDLIKGSNTLGFSFSKPLEHPLTTLNMAQHKKRHMTISSFFKL